MIKFYGLEYTYYDHPGKYSLVLYSGGCNLRCYGCHNRNIAGWDYTDNVFENEKVIHDYTKTFTQLSIDEIKVAVQNEMVDMVIFCGGEFLIYPMSEVQETIQQVKDWNPNVLIRVDTNGSFPQKVKDLANMGIVDGFAIDIKGPYWDERFYEDMAKVVGWPLEVSEKIYPKMIETLYHAKDLPCTLYRTVKYPIIKDDNYFKEIKKYVSETLHKSHFMAEFIKI